jgi:hypothetical protein
MGDHLAAVSTAALAAVIQFPTPEQYDGRTCEGCGSAWFDAAVTIGPDGRVTGWAFVTCRDCGQAL